LSTSFGLKRMWRSGFLTVLDGFARKNDGYTPQQARIFLNWLSVRNEPYYAARIERHEMTEKYFLLRPAGPALADEGGGDTLRSMMSQEGGGVSVLLGPVPHLNLFLIDWSRLLIPEDAWQVLQPRLERDFSAVRPDPGGVWLQVEGKRYRSVEVRRDVRGNIEMFFELRADIAKRKQLELGAGLLSEWRRGLLIAESVWPALQPLLEKDFSAVRHAEVWLEAEGKRHPADPRPYRLGEVPDICDVIDFSLSRFDILDYGDLLRLRTGLAERFTSYPADRLLLEEGIERRRTAIRVETADELRALYRDEFIELNMVRPNPLRFRGRPPRIFLWFDEVIVDSQVAAEIRRSAWGGVMLEPAIIGI
jgi:hypothetical protein